MLTLEFGAPHVLIREPRVPRPGGSERVRRHLRRRHVRIGGDWHLWIQYCDWKISVSDGSCDSESFDWQRPDECLNDLDGQRLIGVGGIHGNSNSISAACWNSGPQASMRLPTIYGASIAGAATLNNRVSSPLCRAAAIWFLPSRWSPGRTGVSCDPAGMANSVRFILIRFRDEANTNMERPLAASLKDGVWIVKGTMPPNHVGGVAELHISKKDGTILFMAHRQ